MSMKPFCPFGATKPISASTTQTTVVLSDLERQNFSDVRFVITGTTPVRVKFFFSGASPSEMGMLILAPSVEVFQLRGADKLSFYTDSGTGVIEMTLGEGD